MSRLPSRLLPLTLASAMLAAMPIAALAQDAAPAAEAAADGDSGIMSAARMFLYSPGSYFGTAQIWLLVLMSMVSMALAIMFLIQNRRVMLLPDETRDEVEALLAEKRYREAIEYANGDPSYLGKLTAAALSEATNGYGAMERAIEETGDAETTRTLRPVEYLNVIGNIAPMLGLFGTVYGMILAFQKLVSAGGADPKELAAGISTALVTTFWGLVVAIPALAAYAVIRNRIDALTAEGILIAEELISPFKPSGKKKNSSSSSSSSSSSPPRVRQQQLELPRPRVLLRPPLPPPRHPQASITPLAA